MLPSHLQSSDTMWTEQAAANNGKNKCINNVKTKLLKNFFPNVVFFLNFDQLGLWSSE
jgi:hypothetical protein